MNSGYEMVSGPILYSTQLAIFIILLHQFPVHCSILQRAWLLNHPYIIPYHIIPPYSTPPGTIQPGAVPVTLGWRYRQRLWAAATVCAALVPNVVDLFQSENAPHA